MLEKGFQKHGDDFEFLFVYIREAHPSDSNWGDQTKTPDPRTLVERATVAKKCTSELSLSLPMVVDDMHDTVNMRYRAWPERIYVIDRQGRIAYKGDMGPWGFDPAAAFEVARSLLEKSGEAPERPAPKRVRR